MLKNVRIWFTKEMECKYISHLDLNRCMLRAVRRAELPIWYTEGFNPHPFITFPLPISLGIDGKRECMDIRITDDEYNIALIPALMNKYLPAGIQVFEAAYPKLDPKYISFASYNARISVDGTSGEELKNKILDLKTRESVIIQKKSKAGMKDIDVLPFIKNMDFSDSTDEYTEFSVVLPAGNTKNISLILILRAIESALNCEMNYSIVKENMYDEHMNPFE